MKVAQVFASNYALGIDLELVLAQENTMKTWLWMTLLFGSLATVTVASGQQDYSFGPDSKQQPEAPQGAVTKHEWTSNKVYPGTVRDYWVYVPQQYDPELQRRPRRRQD